MVRRVFLFGITLPVCLSLSMIGAANPQAGLTAAQIIDKNVSAKGGLQAWRAVQSMSFSGKLEAGGKSKAQLPLVLEKKRPRKTRVELAFANDTALQVYDGTNGWKLRPYLGRKTVEPYSPEELKSASFESDLDGPLVDYASKGNKVELREGREPRRLQAQGHDEGRPGAAPLGRCRDVPGSQDRRHSAPHGRQDAACLDLPARL
jgi:hypothetical protein